MPTDSVNGFYQTFQNMFHYESKWGLGGGVFQMFKIFDFFPINPLYRVHIGTEHGLSGWNMPI